MDNLKMMFREMFDPRDGIQYYNDKFLEDGLMQKILNLSVLNPMVFKSSPFSIIAVKSKEYKYRLYKAMYMNRYIADSAAVLVVLDKKKETYDVDSGSMANLLAVSVMYAAKYYGVECMVLKGPEIKSLENIPGISQDAGIVMLICLGYFSMIQPGNFQSRPLKYSQVVKEL